jgi:hypothetical protein
VVYSHPVLAMSNKKEHSGQIPTSDKHSGGSNKEVPASAPQSTHKKNDGKTVESPSEKKCCICAKFIELWQYLLGVFTREPSAAWTAVFTGLLVFFTYQLVRIADRSDETARFTQRAYINLRAVETGKKINDSKDLSKVAGLEVYVLIDNSGITPATDLLLNMNWQIRKDALPDDFDFPLEHADELSAFGLGPKAMAKSQSKFVPINVFQEKQHSADQTFIYFWGSATYHDMFEPKQTRITQFCMELTTISETGFDLTDPKTNVSFDYGACKKHNCYDEACEEKH